ncbi:hypothetical protein N184_09660 [Sinorhizobium sp. GL28]|nr:hypothetical protein N184_09660 [Sinorhizobium sp. GL28]
MLLRPVGFSGITLILGQADLIHDVIDSDRLQSDAGKEPHALFLIPPWP